MVLLWRLWLSLLLCRKCKVWRRSRVTEASVLREAGDRAECLPALVALDLHAAGGVHAFVSAEVRELRVAFEADLTAEGFDRAVDVCVLLQARASCKCLATFRASMAPGSDMMGPDVTLQVAGIGEYFVAVFARETTVLAVDHFVPEKIWPPCETFGAMFTLILVSGVAV